MLKMKTELFKDLTTKVAKGAGRISCDTRTNLVFINVTDNLLRMATINGNTYFEVRETVEDCENFQVAVDINTFEKLVAKTTSDEITLGFDDGVSDVLVFNGNGTYRFGVILENNAPVPYPSHRFELGEEVQEIELSVTELRNMVKIHKNVEGDTQRKGTGSQDVISDSSGFLFKDNNVYTATRQMSCKTTMALNNDTAFIMPLDAMLLVENLSGETAKFIISGDRVLIQTDKVRIATAKGTNLAIYPNVDRLFTLEFDKSVTMKKRDLLSALDRLLLFVDDRAMYGVQVYIQPNALNLGTHNQRGQEQVYCTANNGTDSSRIYNIICGTFRKQISAYPFEEITICYNLQNDFLLLQSENTCEIITTMVTSNSEQEQQTA